MWPAELSRSHRVYSGTLVGKADGSSGSLLDPCKLLWVVPTAELLLCGHPNKVAAVSLCRHSLLQSDIGVCQQTSVTPGGGTPFYELVPLQKCF